MLPFSLPLLLTRFIGLGNDDVLCGDQQLPARVAIPACVVTVIHTAQFFKLFLLGERCIRSNTRMNTIIIRLIATVGDSADFVGEVVNARLQLLAITILQVPALPVGGVALVNIIHCLLGTVAQDRDAGKLGVCHLPLVLHHFAPFFLSVAGFFQNLLARQFADDVTDYGGQSNPATIVALGRTRVLNNMGG